MGEDVNEVTKILRGVHGWSVLEGAEPEAVAYALQALDAHQIAARLEAWCQRFAGGYGYEQARWDHFNIDVKYWKLNTLVALGLVVEEEPEHIEPARSISEWERNMALGYGRTGYKDGGACDREEYGRRLIASARVPREWAVAGKGEQYRILVLSGGIPVGLHGFDTMYVQKASIDSIPADPTKWFENVSTPQGQNVPWMPDGSRNPNAKGKK